MRTLILYHPKDEFAGMAEDFTRDYQRKHQDQPKVEMVSLDELAGSRLAELYDVVRYPALLIIGPGGQLQKIWQDRPWPLLDEVAAYAGATSLNKGNNETPDQAIEE